MRKQHSIIKKICGPVVWIEMECEHDESYVYHARADMTMHQWAALMGRAKCNKCYEEEEQQVQEKNKGKPWDAYFTPEELTFYEEAIKLAKLLNRPFTEQEILASAYEQGYELDILYCPRFKRISPCWKDPKTGEHHMPTYCLIPEQIKK